VIATLHGYQPRFDLQLVVNQRQKASQSRRLKASYDSSISSTFSCDIARPVSRYRFSSKASVW
jgi:hypothetical protein